MLYFQSDISSAHTYFPWAPNVGSCAGEEWAAFAGMGILSSYLLLFISFYLATYKKPAGKRPGRTRSVSALIEMKDEKIPTIAQVQRRFSGGKENKPDASVFASGKDAPSPRVTRSRKA